MAALEAYGVLDDTPRRELVALVDLAARIGGAPKAAINLFTADEQRQVATVGFEGAACAREDSLCNVVLESGRPLLLEDARADERFADHPSTNGVLGTVRFYASHPLVTPEGVAIGTICVFDEVARAVDSELGSGLRMLAERVVDLLQLELTGRRLEGAVAALATSEERLGAFAGQISHDLKNPLSAISMSLEMARDEVGDAADPDPTVVSLLDRAGRGAARMNSMIGDLLAFAKGGAAPELRPVDLAEALDHVLEDLHDSLDGADVRARGLPVVEGDPVQLRVLLQHLVANALKFTRDAAPQVTVTAHRLDHAWRIEVADNGPGVPEADRERVFEPFNRVDKTIPGTGIGLSTCKRIAEAHGGRIGLAEAPSGGALVWVELPG